MKILCACEESQAVTIELRRMGHEAYSCDILPCSGGHPEWHIQGDVLQVLNPSWVHRRSDEPSSWGIEFLTMDQRLHFFTGGWDMIIAFPPCTDLAVSGARHFKAKRADGRQQRSVEFFCAFLAADCERIAIENPVGIISGEYIREHFPKIAETYGLPRKPDQIIQPWQFGHGETKATCLWLKGLPLLQPTQVVDGREQRVWRMSPSPERAKLRSKTYPGIARAMAEQWAGEAL